MISRLPWWPKSLKGQSKGQNRFRSMAPKWMTWRSRSMNQLKITSMPSRKRKRRWTFRWRQEKKVRRWLLGNLSVEIRIDWGKWIVEKFLNWLVDLIKPKNKNGSFLDKKVFFLYMFNSIINLKEIRLKYIYSCFTLRILY